MHSLRNTIIGASLMVAALAGCGSGPATPDAKGDEAGAVTAAVTNPTCTLCHRAPPPAPHPQTGDQLETCATCHPTTVAADGTLVPSGTHLNGTVNVTCTSCHGFPPAAPHPHQLLPNATCFDCHTDTLSAGKHMNGNVEIVAGGCGYCHAYPPPRPHPTVTSAGDCATCHPDSTTALGGIKPFGAHMNGTVDATCTSCHGFPPPAPHPDQLWPGATCSDCHTDTLNNGKHRNGNIELIEGGCGYCHGNPPAAPHPAATPGTCNSCHAATVTQAGGLVPFGPHMNGTLDVSCNTCHGFPPAAPHPQRTDCSACHGDNLNNGTHMNTRVDLTSGSCGVCHGAPPPAPHPTATITQCASCHPTTVTNTGALVPNGTHMNGTVNVSCNTCHGFPPPNHPATATNCSSCHGDNLNNGTHMNGRIDLTSVSCSACHGAPPPAPHPTATITQCSGCHPTTVTKTGALVPNGTHMNGTLNVTCTNCHGNPPSSHRNAHRSEGGSIDDCAKCHGNNLTNGDHMNGRLDFAPGVSCARCHGGSSGGGGWGGGGGGGW